MDDLKEATKRRASFAQTMKAVFWSFFGVRKGRDHDRDMAQLNPVHMIIAGLLATALFIFVLLMIVRAVVGSQ